MPVFPAVAFVGPLAGLALAWMPLWVECLFQAVALAVLDLPEARFPWALARRARFFQAPQKPVQAFSCRVPGSQCPAHIRRNGGTIR